MAPPLRLFEQACVEGSGAIARMVMYKHQQPTLDTEAQQLVDGDPHSWLFVEFRAIIQKIALPLSRKATGIRAGDSEPTP